MVVLRPTSLVCSLSLSRTQDGPILFPCLFRRRLQRLFLLLCRMIGPVSLHACQVLAAHSGLIVAEQEHEHAIDCTRDPTDDPGQPPADASYDETCAEHHE